jgi:hypothetical protein
MEEVGPFEAGLMAKPKAVAFRGTLLISVRYRRVGKANPANVATRAVFDG